MKRFLLVFTLLMSVAMSQTVTIAEARADTVGDITTIEGIVTGPNFGTAGSRTQHTVQDLTGGLVVYTGAFDAGLQVGDSIRVTGELVNYNGLVEITPASPTDLDTLSHGNALPAFQVLTIAELLANAEDYESELIRIDSAIIVGGSWPTSSSSNLDITDPSGDLLVMRIDSDTDIAPNPEMIWYFNLQGVVGQYDGSDPYDSGYQIFPRFYTDFEPFGNPPPRISGITRDPTGPTPFDLVMVTATITDDNSVNSASLSYTVDSGVEMVVAMVAGAADVYSGVIPTQVANAVVDYTVSATDNEGASNTSAKASYIVYGGSLFPISSIQDGTIPTGTSSVTIEGIVTAEPFAFHSEEFLNFYFIQDAQAPQSGIKIYDPGRKVVEGDQVRLTGTVAEYNDMTELLDITEFEILSSGNFMPPVPFLLSADPELYEGCFIEVVGTSVLSTDLGHGEWSISDGTDSLRVDDSADFFYTPIKDEALSKVVGVMEYTFGNFKLLPRLARDIQTADGLTRIQAIQQVRYSDLMPHYTALDSSLYFADTSYYYEGWTDTMEVTVEGIVTMPTGLSYAGNGVKFILQDVNGGAWSSILSYHPDSSAFPILFEGDLVKLTGSIMEYTTPEVDGASSMTELFISQDPVILDIGLPLPEEPVINTGDLRWPTTAEQWGNVTVKVQNATVTANDPTGFDILAIDDGSGVVYIDDDSDSLANYIQPPVGSTFDEVRGWVYHHYGSYDDSTTYKLVPLYESDLLLNTTGINNMQVPEGFTLRNYPNPFNPVTNIAFRIPEAQSVQLVIYNQLGQHVVTLMDQTMSAGEHELTWRGFDAKGKPVASGLYFYRLVAGSEQLVGKMTYLK